MDGPILIGSSTVGLACICVFPTSRHVHTSRFEGAMIKQRVSRRGFIAGTAAAAATAYYSPSLRAQGANEDIRLAVIGCGSRGQSHITAYKKMKGVRLVALCDADQKALDAHMRRIQTENYGKVETQQDLRR